MEKEVLRLASAPCSCVVFWASIPLTMGNIMVLAAAVLSLYTRQDMGLDSERDGKLAE